MIPFAGDQFRFLGLRGVKMLRPLPGFCNTPVGDNVPVLELQDVEGLIGATGLLGGAQ